jgi:hypothetical protein
MTSRQQHNDPYSTPPTASPPHQAAANSMMRGFLQSTPAMMSSNAGIASNTALSEVRMGQILDEADHKRCSEGNQRALLAEKLESLRRLTKELETDEWKYAPKKPNNGLSLSNFRRTTKDPF